MDSLINAGMKLLDESNQQGQQGRHQQQQQQQQQQHGQHQDSSHGRRRNDNDDIDDELRDAHVEASRYAGSSGSSDFFSSIVSSIGSKNYANDDRFDTHDAVRKHQQVYDDGHASDGSGLGAAAAIQALKKFAGGGSQQPAPSKSSFLATALGEASQLFDSQASQGKVQPGTTKESVVHKAGEFAMKMYIEHQAKQEGGLMGLASKFLK